MVIRRNDLCSRIADDVFPNGWCGKCSKCGKQFSYTKEECAEYLAHGWPKCDHKRAEAAEAENARLQTQLERLGIGDGVTHYDGCEEIHLACKVARLQEENARLREALADISHGPVGYWNDPERAPEVVKHLVDKATKALREVE